MWPQALLAVGLALILGSCAAGRKPVIEAEVKEAEVKPQGKQVAVITTAQGTIRFVLLDQYAPRHVANFIALAEKGFYDNLVFHRVVPGVLIQGGDPKGDGTGGPGHTVKAEFSQRSHTVGAVGMARAQDPDSAGSQFYICIQPLPSLDGKYTVFGQVYEGMDAVGAIQKGERMTQVKIETVPEDKLPLEAVR